MLDEAPSPSILLRVMAAALVDDRPTVERYLDELPPEELRRLLAAIELLGNSVQPRLSSLSDFPE